MTSEKKLSFAIIGTPTPNTEDLCNAVRKSGHMVQVIDLAYIRFEYGKDSMQAFFGDKNILDFDIVLFRAYNKRFYEAQLLARMLDEKGKIVIERSLAGNYVKGKLQQAEKFVKNSVPHPQIWQASSAAGWREVLKNVTFPIIAKPVFGRKGRGICKLDSLDEAQYFFDNNHDDYLAQVYMPIKGDYRVFVVGDKVIGAFKRHMMKGAYVSNKRGTPGEKVDPSEEMSRIAINAVKAVNCEISGVDLLEHNGNFYVIEANVAPQWEKFKLLTGIDPAPEIIRYAIERYLQKNPTN